MTVRRANEVAAHFNELLQTAVSCVTDSVLIPRRNDPGPRYRLLLQPEARLRAADASLQMRVVHSYNVIADPDTGYRVSTASYIYEIGELGEHSRQLEIIGYHWNPQGTYADPDFPHLHVHGEREIGGTHIHKMHLPTGRVSLEAFLRCIIVELHVRTRKPD